MCYKNKEIMKRKILFRGSRKDGKGWVYGNLNVEYEGSFFIYFWYSKLIEPENNYHEMTQDAHEVIPETIGQFTGLTDKNGVKIFEGDIIKYYQPYSKKWETHVVLWDNNFSCFGLFEKDNIWCKENDWMKIKELEIIGNIHDA